MPLVYDVYGTLLDVDAATRQAATEPGMDVLAEKGAHLSALWRQRQLAHSWLNSLMQRYQPFWDITAETLRSHPCRAANRGPCHPPAVA